MDGVRAGLRGRRDNRIHVEIARTCRGGADACRLIGVPDVHSVSVGVGVDGDGPDTQPGAGSHHTHRDLAAIGDQD
jgi:hypothetical protein